MIQEPETLYKLMTLYMLEKVNFPLTNSQLSSFFLDKDYTTYFTLQSVLSELVEANLITSRQVGNSTHYEITDDGKEALGFFGSGISDAAVADMNEYLEANNMRNSLSVGDEVTTIGGIIGRVVSIKDETFVLETTKERTKIRFLRSALKSIDVKVGDTTGVQKTDAPAEDKKDDAKETAEEKK